MKEKKKKIVTALNNPQINQLLKQRNEYEVISKDIQYREAIIEILEKNKNIDTIIINSKIPGKIKLEKLVKHIKEINKKIEIIIILKNNEKKQYDNLKEIGLKKVYQLKNINYSIIFNILKNEKISNKENIKNNNLNKNINKKIILICGEELDKNDLIIKTIIKYLINKKILIININNNKNINVNYSQNIKIKNYYYNNFKIKNKNEIKNFLDKEKKKFDIIFIRIKNCKNRTFFKQIIMQTTDIIIYTNENLLGIKDLNQFIIKYANSFSEQKNSLHIVGNKVNLYSISAKIYIHVLDCSLKKYSININKISKNHKTNIINFNKIKLIIKIKVLLFHLLKNNGLKNKIKKLRIKNNII